MSTQDPKVAENARCLGSVQLNQSQIFPSVAQPSRPELESFPSGGEI